jgi:hypothetical protein
MQQMRRRAKLNFISPSRLSSFTVTDALPLLLNTVWTTLKSEHLCRQSFTQGSATETKQCE